MSTEILGYQKKRHQDWFDENDADIARVVKEKNNAHNNFLNHPTRNNNQKWKDLKRKVQMTTREMKNAWWDNNAKEIQRCADEGKLQAFYEGIKKSQRPGFQQYMPHKRC